MKQNFSDEEEQGAVKWKFYFICYAVDQGGSIFVGKTFLTGCESLGHYMMNTFFKSIFSFKQKASFLGKTLVSKGLVKSQDSICYTKTRLFQRYFIWLVDSNTSTKWQVNESVFFFLSRLLYDLISLATIKGTRNT